MEDLYEIDDWEKWHMWSTSVLNILKTVFCTDSVHYVNFIEIYDSFEGSMEDFECARGVFTAAKDDFEGGFLFSLESSITGEVFRDFVRLARQSLAEGYKDVAAVLASAALEDALKRHAKQNSLAVESASMSQVISALKTKGLVSGAQKTILNTLP